MHTKKIVGPIRKFFLQTNNTVFCTTTNLLTNSNPLWKYHHLRFSCTFYLIFFTAQPPSFGNITVVSITVSDKQDVVLSCLIQPGRHKDKYHVTWKQFNSDNKVVILSTESFNISVNTSLSMANNVAYYACEVKVVYDASHSASYPGGKFRIMMNYEHGDPNVTIANKAGSDNKEPHHSKGK